MCGAGWGVRRPSNGLRAAGSDESGKVGSAPAEGLVSVLRAQGKAVYHHGSAWISTKLSSAAAWPATRILPLTSPALPPLPGVGQFHLEVTIGVGCLWVLCAVLLSL